jgi:hypothetical protein
MEIAPLGTRPALLRQSKPVRPARTNFFDWRSQNQAFRSMTGFRDETYTLGVTPQLGHGFLLGE